MLCVCGRIKEKIAPSASSHVRSAVKAHHFSANAIFYFPNWKRITAEHENATLFHAEPAPAHFWDHATAACFQPHKGKDQQYLQPVLRRPPT